MNLFRRVLRLSFLLMGFVAGLATAAAAFFVQRLLNPPRQRLWATPGDLGMAYEDVNFSAQDGVQLSGWFIAASAKSKKNGAAVVLLHDWSWNRLGLEADDWVSGLEGSTPVDLLRLAYALHQEGYHILMFDLRNHGGSEAAPPVTFGWQEAHDLLGALAYLNGRSHVNRDRIGVVGFSMGANAILYALPQTGQIKAAVAVQPTSVKSYTRRYSVDVLGPLGRLVMLLAELIYSRVGGLRFSALQPSFPASSASQTPVLYVQGRGDHWGSPQDVTHIAEKTPQAVGPLFVDSTHRYGGFQYVIDHSEVITAFLAEYLSS